MTNEMIKDLNSLSQGEKYTLFFFNEWGFPCASQIRFDSYEIAAYAQYKESVKLRFKLKGGRTFRAFRIYGCKTVYVFKGWVNVNTEMFVGNSSRLCFDDQYIKDGLDSVNQKPIVIKAQ